MKRYIYEKLVNVVLFPVHVILIALNRVIIIRDGQAIGDHLIITTLVRIIGKRSKKIVVISNHPDIFTNNPYVEKAITFTKFPRVFQKIIIHLGMFAKFTTFVYFRYVYDVDYMDFARRQPMHLVEICLLHTPYYADVNGKDLSCHLYFTEEEEKSYKKKFNLTKPYAIIQSQAKTSYLPKDWGVKNFQEIVNNVRYNWVQVGEKNEKPLKGVVNLCGKTSLREMIYIVTKAAMVVCNEGLLCHVSSVNNTPCLAIIACDIPKKLTQYQNVTHFKGEIDPAHIINLIRKTLL